MVTMEKLRSKFLGSLVGAALGDAVGAFWEGCHMTTDEEIRRIVKIQDTQRYTDDTHMTIGGRVSRGKPRLQWSPHGEAFCR